MLLGRDHEVLLSDFGIALVTPSTRAQSLFDQSRTSSLIGTVPYMAPEQIQGRSSFASDQYALGVVVYEWLCGQPPFLGMPMEIAVKHMTMLPPLLREKDPTIPADVEKVVLTALAKDPRQRFATVQAFANAFEQACQKASSSMSMPPSRLRKEHSGCTRSTRLCWRCELRLRQSRHDHTRKSIEHGEIPQQPASGWMGTATPLLTPTLPPMHTGYGGEQLRRSATYYSTFPASAERPYSNGAAIERFAECPAPSNHSRRTSHRVLLISLCIVAVVLLLAGSTLGLLTYRNSLPTPAKALDVFCTALQSKDDQTAYHQLSSTFQSTTSEAAFARILRQCVDVYPWSSLPKPGTWCRRI